MRYSQAAASLLSTVLTFQAKAVSPSDDADADNNIFNSTIDPEADIDIGALALTTNDKNEGGIFGFEVHSQTAATAPRPTGQISTRATVSNPKNRLNARTQAQAATDIGILAAADISILAQAAPSKCTAGFVECKDGYLASDSTTTCFAQCAGKCCTEVYFDYLFDSCYKFTGKVCKDGSCNELGACVYATIPSVVNSCKGNFTCYKAGYDEGSIKRMVDSCNGAYACYYAAKDGRIIGDITGSCIGLGACYSIAADNGSIGKITNSCIGEYACGEAAKSSGFIRSISKSCIGDHSCDFFAYNKGTAGVVSNACTNYYSCSNGASHGGSIKSITNSCTGNFSCSYLGHSASKVGDVKDSCKGYASCFYLAGDPGRSVGSIFTSCNADFACFNAGYTGVITSNLYGCCNAEGACELANETTIPAQCKKSNSKVRKYHVVSAETNDPLLRHSLTFLD